MVDDCMEWSKVRSIFRDALYNNVSKLNSEELVEVNNIYTQITKTRDFVCGR